jgi:diacylglycerol kinase family enzyme
VIPKGTANDLAASFGISQDVEKAVKIIAEGHTTLLDTIKVNSSHIVTIGSLGFPALVAKTVNDFKKTRPILKWIHRHILRSSIYSIFVGVLLVTRGVRALAYRGRVFADGKPVFTGSFTAIFFGKQEVLGKNFRPCPGMKHSDPHLRISILKFSGLWSTVRDIFHISKGHPERAHHLVQINANSFFIRTDGFMPLLGDGEILDTDDEFYGERMPGALRLVVPRSETSK